ncbi:MAG: tetratricopeptide repeat protein [Bacteroidales bacterium]|nr:tetratricopeptide repeat protein [Bacteroidales bacterium]
MRHLKIVIALVLTVAAIGASAQSPKGKVRDGNREYKKERFDKAEIEYRKAIEIDSTYYKSHYNLGNTLYRNKNYPEAARQFKTALESNIPDSLQRSRTLHNLGNSYLQQGLADKQNGMENFQQAVNSYQEALKLDPSNNDTRYNLSYALKMLQKAQQQQQQQGGGDNNDKNKDQNQQQKQQNQNKDQDKQDQQNQQNQPQDRQDQNQQQKDGKQNKAEQQRKQDAERLLEAVKNNERQTMKEQNQKVQAGKPVKIDKDW